MNPQPCSFMLNSSSVVGLKPRISVQRVTLASELKHALNSLCNHLAAGPPRNICSSGFQGAERCSCHIWSSTAVLQPNPPAHRHLSSAPSAARSQGQEYKEQQTTGLFLFIPSDQQQEVLAIFGQAAPEIFLVLGRDSLTQFGYFSLQPD